MAIPSSLRDLVILRSGNCCEYCRLSQLGQEATFHVDHVVPVAAKGKTEAENLAWACVSCSLHKSAKQVANDPNTDEEVPLFNPRRQSWLEHFRWERVHVVGLTPTGRATVVALRMNRPGILSIREEEILLGRHPAS